MDTLRLEVTGVAGALAETRQVRIWADDREISASLDGAGPDPHVALALPTPPLLPGDHGPVVISRCGLCLDELCGYHIADIRREGEHLTWTAWARYHDGDGWGDGDHKWRFSFDAAQYTAEVERAAAALADGL